MLHSNERIMKHKVGLLNLVEELGNVAMVCQMMELSRVTVVGASVGTPFAKIHGALDDRVPRVLIVHGGGDLRAIIRAARWEQAWLKTPAVWVGAPAGACARHSAVRIRP